MVERLLEYGVVKNVVSRLQVLHMTLSFSAKIEVDAREKSKAIFDSINTDNKFYPENPTKTEMYCNDKITILIRSDQLAPFRANLNSCIRLVQASHDSIESVKIL